MVNDARATAQAYFDRWTHGRYADAIELLDPALRVEVPINSYPDRDAFARALAGFGALVERVTLLAALGGDGEAVQVYDLQVRGVGALRVAEHFVVADGKICTLRQIHDTAAVRAAGLGA